MDRVFTEVLTDMEATGDMEELGLLAMEVRVT